MSSEPKQWRVLKKYDEWDTDVWWLDDKIEGPNGQAIYTDSHTDAVEIAAALNRDRASDAASATQTVKENETSG